jgi:hypothetical protein
MESVQRKFKEARRKGESVESFFQREFVTANASVGNYAGANSAVKYKNTIIKDLLDSELDDTQRQAMDQRISQEAKIQEDLSKKFGRINAPAITQAMNALAGNKFDGSLTEALVGIYAGNNDSKRISLEGTEEAAELIRTTSDADLTKDDKFSKKIRSIIRGRIWSAQAEGREESVKNLKADDEGENAGLRQDDLKNMLDMGAALRGDRSIGTTAESRKKRLDELEAEFKDTGGKMEGTSEARTQKIKTLEALRNHQKIGTLEDNKAFELATSGTAAGILAGVTQSEVASQKKQLEEQSRAESITTMDERLNAAVQLGQQGGAYKENAAEIEDARKYYQEKYGSEASAKMLEDYAKRDSSKDEDQDNYFKKNKLNENGALSGLLSSTTDDINSKKQQLDAMGKSPTEATQDLNATMQGIMQLLGEDKGLGKTLKNLSDTLLQLRNQ